MNLLKVLLAGAAVGVIVTAFRDYENETWLVPERPFRGFAGAGTGVDEEPETEPLLGYDGMDQDTLIDWLGDADLDRETLLRVRAYEAQNRNREPVLAAVEDLL